MKKYKVDGFVKWEKEFYKSECCFTDDENKFFDLRNRGFSLEEIAEKMQYSVSKINDLSKDTYAKVIKVNPLKDMFFQKYCDKMNIN